MTEPQPRSTGAGVITMAMLAIGALLLTLCGTCTLYFGGGGLWSILSGKEDRSLGGVILITALVVGGLPTLGGLVLFLEGLKRVRRPKPPRPESFD